MDLDKLDKKITKSQWYKFFIKHKKVITIVEGMIIIGLMAGIWIYFFQDYQVKRQIRDTCGFVTNDWECVCEKGYVDFYKEMSRGGNNISVTFDPSKSLGVQSAELVK